MSLFKTKEDILRMYKRRPSAIEVGRDDEPIYTSIWTGGYHHPKLPDEVIVNGIRCSLQQTSHYPFTLSYSAFCGYDDRMTILFQATGVDEKAAVKRMKEKLKERKIRN